MNKFTGSLMVGLFLTPSVFAMEEESVSSSERVQPMHKISSQQKEHCKVLRSTFLGSYLLDGDYERAKGYCLTKSKTLQDGALREKDVKIASEMKFVSRGFEIVYQMLESFTPEYLEGSARQGHRILLGQLYPDLLLKYSTRPIYMPAIEEEEEVSGN